MAGLALLLASPVAARGQTPSPIAIGATAAARHQAAVVLVPLLQDVKRRARPGTSVQPGTASNSPFSGTQTTLFAFTISKRSVPVDTRVVAAMNRLLAWNVDRPGTEDVGRLFDDWLVELSARSSGALRMKGGGLCDVECVVQRMTTLDDTWGASPKNRAELRDEMLLSTLAVVATK